MMIMSRFDKKDLLFYSSVLVAVLSLIVCASGVYTTPTPSSNNDTTTAPPTTTTTAPPPDTTTTPDLSNGTTPAVTVDCTALTEQVECCKNTLCMYCISTKACSLKNTTTEPTCVDNCTQAVTTEGPTTISTPTTAGTTPTTPAKITTPATTAASTTSGENTTASKSSSTTPSDQTTVMTTAASKSKGSGQHFDSASFIGGIVLCGGLVAIAFFGCKFYKAKTDRNYHTL